MNEKGKLFLICVLVMPIWGGLMFGEWYVQRFLMDLGMILLGIHFIPEWYDHISHWLKRRRKEKGNGDKV